MPVFSIGFVVYGSPGTAVVSECGRYVEEWPVRALWERSRGVNCGCDTSACIVPGYICAPAGDNVRVLISVYDSDGDEYDITGATEIVFAVADSRTGQTRIVKTLSEGDITIAGTGYQFVIFLTDEDTVLPVLRQNYYEIRVTNSLGEHKTVSAGSYVATRTIIKDLP